jgi:hypothetical protein
VGYRDMFAKSGSREYLFDRYGPSTRHIVTVWQALAINHPPPKVTTTVESAPGE